MCNRLSQLGKQLHHFIKIRYSVNEEGFEDDTWGGSVFEKSGATVTGVTREGATVGEVEGGDYSVLKKEGKLFGPLGAGVVESFGSGGFTVEAVGVEGEDAVRGVEVDTAGEFGEGDVLDDGGDFVTELFKGLDD